MTAPTSPTIVQDVLALHAQHVTHKAIARSVGISKTTVRRILGRPKTHTVSARLPHPLFDQLKLASGRAGHTVADELRNALTSYYSTSQTQRG